MDNYRREVERRISQIQREAEQSYEPFKGGELGPADTPAISGPEMLEAQRDVQEARYLWRALSGENLLRDMKRKPIVVDVLVGADDAMEAQRRATTMAMEAGCTFVNIFDPRPASDGRYQILATAEFETEDYPIRLYLPEQEIVKHGEPRLR